MYPKMPFGVHITAICTRNRKSMYTSDHFPGATKMVITSSCRRQQNDKEKNFLKNHGSGPGTKFAISKNLLGHKFFLAPPTIHVIITSLSSFPPLLYLLKKNVSGFSGRTMRMESAPKGTPSLPFLFICL